MIGLLDLDALDTSNDNLDIDDVNYHEESVVVDDELSLDMCYSVNAVPDADSGHADGNSDDISFTGVHYTDAEIQHLKDEVSRLESRVSSLRSEVSNWSSKVSLNDTNEHRANGDYSNAVSHYNSVKQQYNDTVYELNKARARLNNAK